MAGLDFNDQDYYAGGDQGYYQHIVLTDIINNFMVSEVGEGMMLANASRVQVEYHAQRGVQELSYDTLRTVKSYEFEPDGRGSITLPQDGVGVLGVFWVDDSGYKHPMNERIHSGNPIAPLEDEQGNFLYDDQGNLLTGDPITRARFNSRTQSVGADAFYNYYAGSFENDELYDRYYSYYGRRFGSDPVQTNINGTYVYDAEVGLIFLDSAYIMNTIVIDYVSDGLGSDLAQVRVHKYAEDAIYQYIRYKMITNMRLLPLYEKQLAKKEYTTTKRRAKHRLSDLTPAKIAQAMKGKYKWIKH